MKFNGLHLSKNYIPSPKTLFTDLSNITFNWPVVWKMTWGIWQIFSRALRIGILMRSFNPNLKKYELKIRREVICHDNEELSKIWRGTDLSFQSWHEEFDEFWPGHLKVSKIFILMASFWAKDILFELKKVQRSYLSWNRRGIQNLERNRLVVSKLAWGIWQISIRALESLKNLHLVSFWEKYILFEPKNHRGVIFHETEEG